MAATVEEKFRKIQQWQDRGDDAAIESLIRTLLHDSDPEVRGKAAQSMGKLGAGGRPVKTLAIEGLDRALGDDGRDGVEPRR
ncbi:MAG: HEAT repeat domain-containing protein [Dehalococcoidia bacterium]